MTEKSENLCTLLIALYELIETEKLKPDTACTKADLCDIINAKLTTVMQKLLCTPYTTNFNLRIADEMQDSIEESK
jgi:hypothetical protein